MKVNYKQLYQGLKQQHKLLSNQLNPTPEAVANEIPDNFNQIGWDVTIEKVELMLSKLERLREIKEKRLTPQFYRSIYNRALIACGEADKLIESLTVDDKNINFESEVLILNAEIVAMQNELAERANAEKAEVEKSQPPQEDQQPDAKKK